MGFIDNSSNNIIIDCVLTDTGRRLLADNQGKFKISFFSLGDDEVDYSTIVKFGRTVGKEKISKNTPVFEAQTNGNFALKHRLITLPNPSAVRLPTLSLDGTKGLNSATNTVSFSTTVNTTRAITVAQKIIGESTVPAGLSDVTFSVFVPDRFLEIEGTSSIGTDSSTRISTYDIVGKINKDTNESTAEFTLRLKAGLDDTTFSIFGNQGDKNTISTVVSVVGDQSGLRQDFSITITK